MYNRIFSPAERFRGLQFVSSPIPMIFVGSTTKRQLSSWFRGSMKLSILHDSRQRSFLLRLRELSLLKTTQVKIEPEINTGRKPRAYVATSIV